MSLYQKYRPQEFDSLSGQEHIKKTLKSALQKNLVSHAYLFCGPRGTGKTTTARLIAKALNCTDFNMETGEPCNKCEICVAITESRFIDVIEIDAASNRGIDEIRELKETIQFAPTIAKNKVYIIDEVHMLTNEAFNALLKTLEEPPEKVFFVLATTEVHKIPETILSRCQRFDFRRINNVDLINRLQFIADTEKLKVEAAALELIAIYSNGGLRDAISILDQLAVNGKITVEDTKKLLGSTGIDTIYSFLESILSGNDKAAFETLKSLHEQGSDINQFRVDILKIAREKLHLAIDKNDLNEKSSLVNLIETWQEIQNKFKVNLIPELPLEILIVRLCNNLTMPVAIAPTHVSVEAAPIIKEMKVEAEAKLPEINPLPAQKVAPVKVNTPKEAETLIKEEGLKSIPAEPAKEEPKTYISSDIAKDWKKIIDEIDITTLKRMLKNTEYNQVTANEAEISIFSDFEFNTIKKTENIHSIESLIEKHSGQKIQISLKKLEPKIKPKSITEPENFKAEIPAGVPVQFNDGADFEPFDMFDGDVVE